MKKLFFTALALVAFSSVSLANTEVKTSIKEFTITKVVNSDTTLDDKWYCVEVSRSSRVLDNGLIEVTVTYRCFYVDPIAYPGF